MHVNGEIMAVGDLSSSRRREMLRLMHRYYENAREAQFECDLNEKDWVITLVDSNSDELCGFSTQMILTVPQLQGPDAVALFSGDTIVDEPYRRCNLLAGLWGRLVLALLDQFPAQPMDWFLISKGYKTYRFLPVFFEHFYPRYNQPTPCEIASRIALYARAKYPHEYDGESGLIQGNLESCRLRAGKAEISRHRMTDPHVRYFCERNPRHGLGDELCCIAPLSRQNFTAAAWRVILAAPSPEIRWPTGLAPGQHPLPKPCELRADR